MSSALPIEVKSGRLPLNYKDTLPNFALALYKRMRISILGNKVLLGSTGATEPNYDAGPRIPGRSILTWDRTLGRYKYIPITVASGNYLVKVDGTFTANRDIQVPNAAGTWAMLYDVYVPRDTALPNNTGGTVIINGADFENWYFKLHENVTVTFPTGVPNGKTIGIGILNDGTSYTVAWSASVLWPNNGAPPVQPIAQVGGSGFGFYLISNINGVLYGEAIDSSPAAPTGTATSVDPMNNYAGTGNQGPAQNVNRIHNLP